MANHLQYFIVRILRIKRLMMIRGVIAIYSKLFIQNTMYRRSVVYSSVFNEFILQFWFMKRRNNSWIVVMIYLTKRGVNFCITNIVWLWISYLHVFVKEECCSSSNYVLLLPYSFTTCTYWIIVMYLVNGEDIDVKRKWSYSHMCYTMIEQP